MLSERLQEELNKQINVKLYSSYLYLSMSAYFKSTNLSGFANWIYIQAKEELIHAVKFYDFINQRGGKIVLKEIMAPPTAWESPQAVFEEALKYQNKVTGLINGVVEISIKERDHGANVFLQWFVSEQMETEEKTKKMVEKLKLLKGTQGAFFMLDRELSLRTS